MKVTTPSFTLAKLEPAPYHSCEPSHELLSIPPVRIGASVIPVRVVIEWWSIRVLELITFTPIMDSQPHFFTSWKKIVHGMNCISTPPVHIGAPVVPVRSVIEWRPIWILELIFTAPIVDPQPQLFTSWQNDNVVLEKYIGETNSTMSRLPVSEKVAQFPKPKWNYWVWRLWKSFFFNQTCV